MLTWTIKKRPNEGIICRYEKSDFRFPLLFGFKSGNVYMNVMIQYALVGLYYFLWVKQFKVHITVQFLYHICDISQRALTGNVTPLPFTTILHFGGYKSSWTQLVSARQNLQEKTIIKSRIIYETKHWRIDQVQFVNWLIKK